MELTDISTYLGHVVRSFLSLKSMDDKLLDGNVLDKLSAVGFIRTEEVAVA